MRLPLGDIPKTPDKAKNKTKKSKHNHIGDENNDSQSTNNENKWQTLLNWERSLLNCTNLSQLFIHFQSLDESIAWSKSALNTRCKLCRKKGDAEKMLLCDKCDRGHHIFCLRPVLKIVPEGEWFCPDCRPKNIEKTPRKIRKSFIEQENELFSDEDAVGRRKGYTENDDETQNR